MAGSFGPRIKELRKEAGITQEDLARKLGISKQTMSIYENGREPPYRILCKIASYFDVSTDYLLGSSNIKSPAYQVIQRDDLPKQYPVLTEQFSTMLEKLTMCADEQNSICRIESMNYLLSCLCDIIEDFWILSEAAYHRAINNDEIVEHTATSAARATHKMLKGIIE